MDFTYIILHQNAEAILKIRELFSDYKGIRCAAMIKSISELEDLVLKHMPDFLILDLDNNFDNLLLELKGFHQYLDVLPKLVGISKDTDKSYKAIKASFFDYWLLPLSESEVRKTILKLKKLPTVALPRTICLKSYKDYHYINTDEILYLKADNNATDFFLKDGRKISAFKTLKTFEHKLPDNFMRVHQSYIINSKYVSRINYGKSICTLTNNKSGLPFSRSYKEKVDQLKELLSKNAISTLS